LYHYEQFEPADYFEGFIFMFGESEPSLPENAFLIIDGTKAVPLNQAVITIGRHHDNMVVIDDPRVSRHHMELRAIQGRFVLFDLESSGGTYINGQRTSQAVVYPGDVISLAGVNIHFVKDVYSPRRNRGNTTFFPGQGERGTAIFRTTFLNKKKK
jgi:pSer/pThr/pTyr-binding forkhead associated (FHA) protein